MTLIVTPNETALLNAFKEAGVAVETENLLVGDVQIRKGEDTVYIIERKAKGDLDASIKDGRYREQKSRLLETGIPRQNIIYLIEQLKKGSPAVNKRVWSAMTNSQHRDGFTVFQTKNIAETVQYLTSLANSVSQFTAVEDSKVSNEVNLNIRKRQVSQQDWFKYSLTLIPKCSLAIAEVIVTEYPTLGSLVEELQERGLECLADLKHGETSRRIGNKLSVEICETIAQSF